MSSSILFPTNEYAISNKSAEQIQRLMVPEQPELETLLLILNKAHPLQLPYAYRNIHNYPDQMIGLVCSRLSREDHENQVFIVESLKKITPPQVTNDNINLIFDSLLEGLQNWTTINTQHLVQGIYFLVQISLRKPQLLAKLEKVCLEMGKLSEPIISKVIAGRLVPILCKYSGRTLKSELMDIIKRIIADSEAEAKKVFLSQIFPKLLENLKLQFIELHLQEKIYETVYDQNEQIGLMALETILRNTTKFSLQEQSSRIVKLFIDSLTSKNEKIAAMMTGFMGETYQKLQGIILKNESNCLKFWKSLIEVAESKNQKILNNFIINLPGILLLSKKHHRVDSLCEVYAELFFNPDADTLLLVSYFHEMVQMFPSRIKLLKETAYSLFSQIFEEAQVSQDSLKIADCLMMNLYESRQAFFQEKDRQSRDLREDEDSSTFKTQNEIRIPYFEPAFNDIMSKYITVCLNRKNGSFISNLYNSISKCVDFFAPVYSETTLLPKLYSAVRSKAVFMNSLIKLIVSFLSRECSSAILINNYASKVNVELSKSTRGYEREAAMLFFYYASFEFSIDTFHEFKMGEKFLQFNNEKSLKNKLLFIRYLPRLIYFFTREEKIEYTISLTRLKKDMDPEVVRAIQETDFSEKQEQKSMILAISKKIKEKEKMRTTLNSKKIQFPNRRETKDLRKQDVLKKRLETRSRTKILIKQMPKKRTPMTMSRPSRKNPLA